MNRLQRARREGATTAWPHIALLDGDMLTHWNFAAEQMGSFLDGADHGPCPESMADPRRQLRRELRAAPCRLPHGHLVLLILAGSGRLSANA